jgi:HSP20 family protein
MLTRRPQERRSVATRSPLDWLLEDPWSDRGSWPSATMPSIDMRETDDAFVVEAEMPGVRPDDVDVTLDGRTLVIRGEYGTEQEKGDGKNGRYLLRERRSGTYTRAITLPGAVDAEHAESSFENGELTLTLPKAAEARTRRIPVSGGAGSAKRVGPSSETRTSSDTGNGH